MRPRRLHAAHLLLLIDLIGTALFAAEGATTAMRVHLDLLGILALAFVTALGGGIVRDVLIGAVPPSSIRDWRYAAAALAAGVGMFALHVAFASNATSASHAAFVSHAAFTSHAAGAGINPWVVTTLDAAGLAFFAAAGAAKALEYGLHPLLATMMGGITGVGGGTIRDLLINRVPTVLNSDVYASAALAGAGVTVLLLKVRVPPAVASATGIAVCFGLRMVAVGRGWNLPRA